MIRFCPVPYDHLHFDPGGNVRLCAWMDIGIGNILYESIESIWRGERAQRIRQSFADGSFRFCRKTSCPYLENDSLERLDETAYKQRTILPKLPTSFDIANDFVCNHSCPSCRDHVFVPDDEYLRDFGKMAATLISLLNQSDSFSVCGNGDLFASPHMLRLLSQVHPMKRDCRIILETNGALFDEKHWKQISHFGEYKLSVTVTPNSFVEATHRYLCGGHHTWSAVMKNLMFIHNLRKQGAVKHYEISIVLQDRNIWELKDFVRESVNRFSADAVIVKPLYNWFTMSDEMYWFKDVLNPLHPYHAEAMEILQDPVFDDPRVFLWGARNEHLAAKHPAYVYETFASCLHILAIMDDFGKLFQGYLAQIEAKDFVLYGENLLTEPVIKKLQGEVHIPSVMAKEPQRQTVAGIPVQAFCAENIAPVDTVIVLNFDKIQFIQRDFAFVGFKGKIVSFADILKAITNKGENKYATKNEYR